MVKKNTQVPRKTSGAQGKKQQTEGHGTKTPVSGGIKKMATGFKKPGKFFGNIART